jgi:hypothetical protein
MRISVSRARGSINLGWLLPLREQVCVRARVGGAREVLHPGANRLLPPSPPPSATEALGEGAGRRRWAWGVDWPWHTSRACLAMTQRSGDLGMIARLMAEQKHAKLLKEEQGASDWPPKEEQGKEKKPATWL